MADAFYYSFPLLELASMRPDFYTEVHAECETCGSQVPEHTLWQCEFGFCGKFVCEGCGFRCVDCPGNIDNLGYCFCDDHAEILRPMCCKCQERRCQLCSHVQVVLRKCAACYGVLCSVCEEDLREHTGSDWKCSRCRSDTVKTLQDSCRFVIRQALASENTVDSRHIQDRSQKLPLPTPLKNFISFK